MKYYVYGLTDPRKEDQLFYIGKGCDKRYLKHFKETQDTTINQFKFNVIAAIRKEGLEPGYIIIKDCMTGLEAYDFEESLILKYGRRGIDPNGILTNICLGVKPPDHTGRKHSDETKLKMSIAAKGKKKSAAHRLSIGDSKRGEQHPNWNQLRDPKIVERIRKSNLQTKRFDPFNKTPEGEKKRSKSGLVTWNMVKHIRQLSSFDTPTKQIKEMYPLLSESTIRDIATGRTWKD